MDNQGKVYSPVWTVLLRLLNRTVKRLRAIYLWFTVDNKRVNEQRHVNIVNKLIRPQPQETVGPGVLGIFRPPRNWTNKTNQQEYCCGGSSFLHKVYSSKAMFSCPLINTKVEVLGYLMRSR